MAATMGGLLKAALARMEDAQTPEGRTFVAARFGGAGAAETLPIVISIASEKPRTGEKWSDYRERTEGRLAPLREQLQTAGVETKSLVSANALAADLHLDQVGIVQQLESAEVLELDPLLQVTAMDDTVADVERETFAQNHPGIDGTGVRVAVLDSGVDEQHSFLNVAASVETCNESVDIPGSHGTHCAGSIASTDALFPGIAPGATLLNVKRLRSWL